MIGEGGGGLRGDVTLITALSAVTVRQAPAAELSGHNVTLWNSTVSGNSTSDDDAGGGGIFSYFTGFRIPIAGSVTSTNSTVSGNSTAGSGASGGGIIESFRNADQQHSQWQQHCR